MTSGSNRLEIGGEGKPGVFMRQNGSGCLVWGIDKQMIGEVGCACSRPRFTDNK